MPKSLFVRDLLNVEHVFFGCIMIAESTFKFLRSVFFHHLMIIALIFGIGLALIGIRWLVFWAAPHLKHGAVIVAAVIDGLEVIFYIFFTVFKIIFNVTSAIIFEVERVACALTLCHAPNHPASLPIRKFNNRSIVSPSQVRHALDRVTVACVKYDNVPDILTLAFRKYLGPSVCPMVRYLFPVSFLYEAALSIAWFSPDPTPIGYAGENNCKTTGTNNFDFVCMGMGSGYIVLELILPLFILILLLAAMTVPTFHLISVLLRLASTTIESAYKITHFIVTRMDESLVWLIDEVLVLKHRHGLKKPKNRREASLLPSQPSQRQ